MATEKATTQILDGRSSEAAMRNGWTMCTPNEDQPAIDQVALPEPFLLLPGVCVVVVAHVRPWRCSTLAAPP
jgi:hypothetical protein